jgi:DeoR family fructose operon transcriptional repressor
MSMLADERRLRILERLAQQRSVTVSELAEAFGASESTIRRDLDDLERQGLLRRTHGGAVAVDAVASFEPSLQEKDVRYPQEKQAIARAAAELVRPGDTVLLDAGTTTLQIARQLATLELTVVTNSVPIAMELSSTPQARVHLMLLGGDLRRTTGALVGPFAERMLADLHVDLLFLGANGLHADRGVTTPNPLEAAVKAAMIRSARRVAVVADHSKVGQVSLVKVCDWDEVDLLITDRPAPQLADVLAQHGVRLVAAEPEPRAQAT